MLKIKGIFTAIITVVIIIAILYLTYIATRRLADGTGMAASSEMKILDRLAVGNDRMLAIVQVHNDFFLMGITSQSISLIRELDGDEPWVNSLREQQVNKIPAQPFKDVYKKMKNIKDSEKRMK